MSKKYLIYTLLFFSFSFCKKETAPLATTIYEECSIVCPHLSCLDNFTDCNFHKPFNAVTPLISGPHFYPKSDTIIKNPVFNPNNINQICFNYNDLSQNATGHKEIVVWDACSETSLTIYNNPFVEKAWNGNDWITFTDYNNRIHKIKPNGDSLTTIKSYPIYINSRGSNPKSDKIWVHIPNQNLRPQIEIIDFSGNLIRTIDFHMHKPIDWINDTTLLTLSDNKLYSITLISQTPTLLNQNAFHPYSDYIYDESNNSVLIYEKRAYSEKQQLKRASLDLSNKVELIKEFNYAHQVIPSDILNNQIIGTVNQYFPITTPGSSFYELNRAGIMDIIGENERIINF